jgi:hypothetical protein
MDNKKRQPETQTGVAVRGVVWCNVDGVQRISGRYGGQCSVGVDLYQKAPTTRFAHTVLFQQVRLVVE